MIAASHCTLQKPIKKARNNTSSVSPMIEYPNPTSPNTTENAFHLMKQNLENRRRIIGSGQSHVRSLSLWPILINLDNERFSRQTSQKLNYLLLIAPSQFNLGTQQCSKNRKLENTNHMAQISETIHTNTSYLT